MLAWLFVVAMVARVAHAVATRNMSMRHARYRMNARLARWVMDGKLRDVSAGPKGTIRVKR